MSERAPGLHDPDNWIGWWLDLHPSDLFYGEIARLALRCIEHEESAGGVGVQVLRVSEEDEDFAVEVRYIVEQFPEERMFHVLSIRSAGDALPPFVD